MNRVYARILCLCVVLALLASAGCEQTPQQKYDAMMSSYKEMLKSHEKISASIPTVRSKSAWDRFLDSLNPNRMPKAPTVKP